MPASINFTLPVSEIYFARSRAELNTFFSGMYVDTATTLSFGVVKQAAAVPYTAWSAWDNDDTVTVQWMESGTPMSAEVPSIDNYNDLKIKMKALHDAYVDLKTKLISAGLVQADS